MSTLQRSDLRRLRKYSSRLNRMIADGSFDRLPDERRTGLLHRLRRLHDRLLDVVPAATLRHILAAAAVLVLGVSACTGSHTRIGGDGTSDAGWDPGADTIWDPGWDPGYDPGWDPGWDTGYDPGWDPGTDPGYDPHYDPHTPNFFSEGRLNPFGIDNSERLCGWELVPDLANLDGDGDLDLFGGGMWYEYRTCIQYFENTGSPSSPGFASPEVNPFGISGRGTSGGPALVDIDGDGDLDLFVGGTYGYYYGGDTGLKYFENTGTPRSPAFEAPVENPFGISGIRGNVTRPAFVDIDGDGDLDMFTNSYSYWEEAGLQFLENTGGASSPRFGAPVREPFGLGVRGWQLTPAFADLDRDGDQDLFMSGSYGYYGGDSGLKYYQNIGSRTAPAFAPPVADAFGLDVPFYMAFPTFGDIDSDGDEDLFVGVSYGIVIYYENTEY